MTYIRKNRGVCSGCTKVELDPAGLITRIEVEDGCDGNLTGLCRLLVGQSARQAADRLRGTRCDDKPTSCPDQIALCLDEAVAKLAGSN